MGRFFIPRQWRLPKIVYGLMILELPFTVANLTLFGIASPNLYRTILREEGARMGFNSNGLTELYAAANYRPVNTPLVWSNFNTQYNLVIGVLCMFFWLVKVPLWLLHVFYPIFSLPLHLAMTILWAYSIYVQTAPDTIDKKHVNNGAPWFITKNCDIVQDKIIKHYCMQAKSSFAVSVCMLAINAAFLIMTIYSLVPTKEARAAHETKVAEKKADKEKWAALERSLENKNEMSPEEQWQHMWELQQLPRTPGTAGGMKSPMTPRSKAFTALDGGHDAMPGNMGDYYGQDVPRSPRMVQQQAEWYQNRGPQAHEQDLEEWKGGKPSAY